LKYQPPVFDRPIIILASPRSGSTLLFETLSKAKNLWTIGDESHAVIEHIPEFSTVFNGFKSNELTEEHGSAENINLLKLRFQQQLRDNKGRGYTSINNYPIRFLEKTPKNSLRIRFLNKVFPDALFIHLVRDPKENISSIIDGWNSKHFITYPNLPKFNNSWSYLLPPNWQSLQGKSIDHIASYQWEICNQTIHDELQKLPIERRHMVHYQDFLDNTPKVIKRIFDFMDIEMDAELQLTCQAPLPYSKFTLSQPTPNKWLKNISLLENNMDRLNVLVEQLNIQLSDFSKYTINNTITTDMK